MYKKNTCAPYGQILFAIKSKGQEQFNIYDILLYFFNVEFFAKNGTVLRGMDKVDFPM
jgi:hypothetical protein